VKVEKIIWLAFGDESALAASPFRIMATTSFFKKQTLWWTLDFNMLNRSAW
jgi:hypothetical protein